VSIDCGLSVRALREKLRVEELKLSKAKVQKWTRFIDLRWMCGTRYRTPGMEYSGEK
jgi:hypothetical protein